MRNYTFLLGIVSDNIASILRLLRGDSIGARHRRTQDGRKRLQQQVAHIQLICWVLEGHHIMRMARVALGISTGGKHVLTQVDNGDILTMRIFGEQVKDAFVSAPFILEIIHDQKSSLGKPPEQCSCFWCPFVKHDPSRMHGLKSLCPLPVTVINRRRRDFQQIQAVQHEVFSERGFATSRPAHDQDTGGCAKSKRWTPLANAWTTDALRCVFFKREGWGTFLVLQRWYISP